MQPTGDDLKIVGLDYVLVGRLSRCDQVAGKGGEFDPKNKDAWYYLGRAYYTKGRLPEAQKSVSKVARSGPTRRQS